MRASIRATRRRAKAWVETARLPITLVAGAVMTTPIRMAQDAVRWWREKRMDEAITALRGLPGVTAAMFREVMR